MTHSEKLEKMHQHMVVLGVSPATSAPPAWRLLWRFGIEASPPLFSRFWPLTLATGSFFGLFWGLFMWLLFWSWQGMPIGDVAGAALLAGLLFGLCMAAYFRYLAHKHHLPLWDEYTGPRE